MKISFIFCYNVAWYAVLSPLISFFDNKKRISHMVIVLENGFGQSWVYESVFPKAKKTEFSKWAKNYEIKSVYSWTVPTDKNYLVYEWLESQMGKKYSFGQIFFILFSVLNKGFDKISYSWKLNNCKWLVCTELGSRFAEKFFNVKITESHDRIGLLDMIKVSDEAELTKDLWRQ